jgi:UDP-N-acetylmuramyl tripeptide synthase
VVQPAAQAAPELERKERDVVVACVNGDGGNRDKRKKMMSMGQAHHFTM